MSSLRSSNYSVWGRSPGVMRLAVESHLQNFLHNIVQSKSKSTDNSAQSRESSKKVIYIVGQRFRAGDLLSDLTNS